MFATADKPRGCGRSRNAGGVYLETGFSSFGSPLEDFLIDPVVYCDAEKLGLSPRNPLLFTTETGVVHIIDWVGETFYPNPADFLEEVRRLGVSRRLELTREQYMTLTAESRLFIVHPKAYVASTVLEYASAENMKLVGYEWEHCPQNKHSVADTSRPCAGWLWQRTDHHVKPHNLYSADRRFVIRKMPAFSYAGVSSCDAFLDADPAHFQPGFVANFPIGRLVVVKDTVGQLHQEKMEKLRDIQLRVDEVDL